MWSLALYYYLFEINRRIPLVGTGVNGKKGNKVYLRRIRAKPTNKNPKSYIPYTTKNINMPPFPVFLFSLRIFSSVLDTANPRSLFLTYQYSFLYHCNPLVRLALRLPSISFLNSTPQPPFSLYPTESANPSIQQIRQYAIRIPNPLPGGRDPVVRRRTI